MLSTSNTGRLAAQCLAGSEVSVHGVRGSSLAPPFDLRRPALVLYPSRGAEPLSLRHFDGAEQPTLYVPDGSWRQARRMLKQLPWLARMKHVCLPPGGAPSTYRLRAGRDADDLATAEAIARAMGIVEGADVRNAIEHIFRIMVERTLFARGALRREFVFGGIPDDVDFHGRSLPAGNSG